MSKPRALLFFTRDKTELAKDMAGSIRAEGNLCNMVYATAFNPEELTVAEAIIIQASYGGAQKIADAYRARSLETEIHLYDDDGEFLDGPVELAERVVPNATEGEQVEQVEDTPAEGDASAEEAAAVPEADAETKADAPVAEEGNVPGDGTPVTQ